MVVVLAILDPDRPSILHDGAGIRYGIERTPSARHRETGAMGGDGPRSSPPVLLDYTATSISMKRLRLRFRPFDWCLQRCYHDGLARALHYSLQLVLLRLRYSELVQC